MPDSWMCAHEGSTDISSEATAALGKLRFSESPVDKLAQQQVAKDASAGAAADSHQAAAEHETLGVQVPFCLPVDQAVMESGDHLCRTLNLMLPVLDPCDETGGNFHRKVPLRQSVVSGFVYSVSARLDVTQPNRMQFGDSPRPDVAPTEVPPGCC